MGCERLEVLVSRFFGGCWTLIPPRSIKAPQARRLLIAPFVLLFSATACADNRKHPNDTKITRGWVCNAYGLSGNWTTITGSPKATKEAAQRDVMKDCRKSSYVCQPSGCWPVNGAN